MIDYWWSTPILSVFQLYHGIRHSDWLLVINSNLVSISVIPWYKTQWLIIDTVIDYWWSTPILSVFQLYHGIRHSDWLLWSTPILSVFQLCHGIRHSDWLLVINSNLVSISVIPWYKTQWLIIGDQLQSCQYFSYAMV